MSFHKIKRRAEQPPKADQSAVGTMNRPLLYDQMILFICLIERDHGDLGHFAAWCEAT